MRSRFSAYVTNNIQYIYRTWDKNSRPPLNVLRQNTSQKFITLEIINTNKGGKDDETGTVEFIATYLMENTDSSQDIAQQHHENSYFVKKEGKWKYVNEVSKIATIKD